MRSCSVSPRQNDSTNAGGLSPSSSTARCSGSQRHASHTSKPRQIPALPVRSSPLNNAHIRPSLSAPQLAKGGSAGGQTRAAAAVHSGSRARNADRHGRDRPRVGTLQPPTTPLAVRLAARFGLADASIIATVGPGSAARQVRVVDPTPNPHLLNETSRGVEMGRMVMSTRCCDIPTLP